MISLPPYKKERTDTNRREAGWLAALLNLFKIGGYLSKTILAGVILFTVFKINSQIISVAAQYTTTTSIVVITNSPSSIILKASYPTALYWNYMYSTNSIDWMVLAPCEKRDDSTNIWTPEIYWPNPPSPLYIKLAETAPFVTTILTNAIITP